MADGRLKTTGGKQKMSFYFIKYIPILLHTSEKLLFLGSDLPSIPNYCGQSAFKINKKIYTIENEAEYWIQFSAETV